MCFINALFVNVIIAWILFYLSQSFQYPVPWEKCPLLENASGFGEEEVKDEKRGNREVGGNLAEEKGARSDKEEEDCGRKKKWGERGKEEGAVGADKEEGRGHPV